MKKFKTKIFFWASDTSFFSGEGILANQFLKQLKKKYIVKQLNGLSFKKKTLFHKYIEPFYGIAKLWIKFLQGNRVSYINYLPMWNSLIYLILPPNTILGPITGGSINNKLSISFNSIIRSYIFPFLYLLTELIILFRFQKILFSTNLLEDKVFKIILKRSLFNYVYTLFNFNKITNKKKQIIVYYKKHYTKSYKILKNSLFLKFLHNNNFKVIVIGDYYHNKYFTNKGFVTRKKVNLLLKQSLFSIGTTENYYSIFSIDSINNQTKIIYENINKNKLQIFKQMFVSISDLKNKTQIKKKDFINDYKKVKKLKSKFNIFFQNL